MKAIEVSNLTKYYGNLLAVNRLNFEVKKGEIFGFLGPNGAGKTTTIRMLTGLSQPSEGSANIIGYDLKSEIVEVKRGIGVVPEVSNLYDELTALENLIFMGQLYNVPTKERKSRAEELLRTFRLYGKKDVPFGTFSKGMKRSLTIAAALVHRPQILFLDEPTSGLDVMSARSIRALVLKLRAQGVTIFLTTHYIEEADQLCDRIAIIVKGKIVVIDTPENLKKSIQEEPIIEISVDTLPDQALKDIQEISGIIKVTKANGKFRFYLQEEISTILPSIVVYFKSRGLKFNAINTVTPSLEDAFIKLTGLDREIMLLEKGGK